MYSGEVSQQPHETMPTTLKLKMLEGYSAATTERRTRTAMEVSHMNYQTVADIFRGLAQTSTWGCFDEFNHISIEVLSAIATQVKTIQDCTKKA
eukprot:gene4230-5396_t